MKRRRRILLIVSGCVVAVLLAAAFWPGEHEPAYQGRTLSRWLCQYLANDALESSAATAAMAQASNAVWQIGTDALPLLVKWLDHETPPWRTKLADAMPESVVKHGGVPLATLILGKGGVRVAMADSGFTILGEKAAPAVPALTQLFAKSTNDSICESVLEALACTGAAGVRPLMAIVTNQTVPPDFRVYAVNRVRILGTNASWAVPVLAACLQDTNVAYAVADALGVMELEPAITVPALTRCLQADDVATRLAAVHGLGRFRGEATSAIPQLLAIATNSNPVLARSAMNALRLIAPERFEKSAD